MTKPDYLEKLMSIVEDDDGAPPIFTEEEVREILPTMNKPVVSQEVEEAALDAISQFLNREQWSKWGMDSLREKGIGVLLEGPPGTGKTTLAAWLAKRVKKGFLMLSGAEIGGGDPGSSERNVIAFFDNARRRKNATIFLDECDHLLMNREDAEETWQLGVIETLMVQMNTYPGLILAATNHYENLDPALVDRFEIVHIGNPDFGLRVKLWRTKIPRAFPFQPTEIQVKELAKHHLTGRTIENVIISVASHCIRKGIKPTMTIMQRMCEKETAKKAPSHK